MVLVDLRFSSLPQGHINEGIETLREKLFALGFSVHHQSEISQVEALPINDGKFEFKQLNSKRWDFINLKRTQSVTFTAESLCLRATDYSHFEGFKDNWDSVASAFIGAFKKVENAGMKRMGLRYMDAIIPQHGDRYTDYINNNWLSLNQKNSGEHTLYNHKQLTKTPQGWIRIELEERVPIHGSIHLLPQDIIDPDPIALNIVAKEHWGIIEYNKYAILDIDHAWVAEDSLISLTQSNISDKLADLHLHSSKLFWNIMSEYAEQTWHKKIYQEEK